MIIFLCSKDLKVKSVDLYLLSLLMLILLRNSCFYLYSNNFNAHWRGYVFFINYCKELLLLQNYIFWRMLFA